MSTEDAYHEMDCGKTSKELVEKGVADGLLIWSGDLEEAPVCSQEGKDMFLILAGALKFEGDNLPVQVGMKCLLYDAIQDDD